MNLKMMTGLFEKDKLTDLEFQNEMSKNYSLHIYTCTLTLIRLQTSPSLYVRVLTADHH